MHLPIQTGIHSSCQLSRSLTWAQLFTPGHVKAHEHPPWHVNKPLGYSFFPKELAPIPRAWAATTGDLVYYKEHSSVRTTTHVHDYR